MIRESYSVEQLLEDDDDSKVSKSDNVCSSYTPIDEYMITSNNLVEMA
jgi:hypothetical protein